MSTRRRGTKQQGRKPPAKASGPDPNEFWRAMPDLEPPEPIRPAAEPTALLRSLGTPPFSGLGAMAEHHLALVTVRAANLAQALAASSGLLATDDDTA
jgi:hypothetical protein